MERGYPRPRGRCNDCDSPIVMCWGEKTVPYWRHISKMGCDTNPGESETHRIAKEMLRSFLVTGTLDASTRCTRCGVSKRRTVGRCKEYIVEARIDGGSFDVAGIDCDKMIGFEIFHTHKTTNLKSRERYEWYEFNAVEVLHLLDREVCPSHITLHDRRTDRLCVEGTNDMCIDHLTIAKRLGYYRVKTRYPREILRILDEAETGYYVPDKTWWTLKSYQAPYNTVIEGWQLTKNRFFDTYGELVLRERCLKCDLPRKGIALGRPFCRRCYLKVKSLEEEYDSEDEWIYDDEEDPPIVIMKKSKRVEDLRDALTFLDNAPDYDDHYQRRSVFCRCVWCDHTIIPGVKWNGVVKRVCLDCVEEKFCE